MTYRTTLFLSVVSLLVGCAGMDNHGESHQAEQSNEPSVSKDAWSAVLRLKSEADCPGTVIDDSNGVLCIMDFPGGSGDSHQTIVSLGFGADCPGTEFAGLNGVYCLIDYPKGWRPFVHDGHLFYKIELSGS